MDQLSKKEKKQNKKAKKEVEEFNKKLHKDKEEKKGSLLHPTNLKFYSLQKKNEPPTTQKEVAKLIEEKKIGDVLVEEEDFGIFGDLATLPSLDSTVKTVFETKKMTEAIEDLDTLVLQSEKEIERICNDQYQHFITSIDQLLELKKDSQTLKENISRQNMELQNAGGDLVSRANSLFKIQNLKLNLLATIEKCQECLYFLNMVKEFRDYLHKDKKEYILALKILKRIESIWIPQLGEFSFVELFKQELPTIKAQIKIAAKDQFADWVFSTTPLLSDLGQFALSQMHQDIQRHEMHQENRLLKKEIIKIERPQILEESLFQNKKYNIDFAPLYRVQAIFQLLDLNTEFETLYRENRQVQKKHLFQAPNKK